MIQALDMGRIQSVFLVKFFLNLISNAAKIKSPGSISSSIRVWIWLVLVIYGPSEPDRRIIPNMN